MEIKWLCIFMSVVMVAACAHATIKHKSLSDITALSVQKAATQQERIECIKELRP